MSDYNSSICLCGKKKLKLNETNWRRHLTFCSVSKLKKSNIVNDVSSFFIKKREIHEVQDFPKKVKQDILHNIPISIDVYDTPKNLVPHSSTPGNPSTTATSENSAESPVDLDTNYTNTSNPSIPATSVNPAESPVDLDTNFTSTGNPSIPATSENSAESPVDLDTNFTSTGNPIGYYSIPATSENSAESPVDLDTNYTNTSNPIGYYSTPATSENSAESPVDLDTNYTNTSNPSIPATSVNPAESPVDLDTNFTSTGNPIGYYSTPATSENSAESPVDLDTNYTNTSNPSIPATSVNPAESPVDLDTNFTSTGNPIGYYSIPATSENSAESPVDLDTNYTNTSNPSIPATSVNPAESPVDLDTNFTSTGVLIDNDPDGFCMLNRLPPAFIDFLLIKGPAQPTHEDISSKEFPKDKSGRSFQVAWYWKKLPENTLIRRDWLSYSKIRNKAFCHHCILFGKKGQKCWTHEGFSAWSRAVSSIQLHECSDFHIEASLKFKMRLTALPILPLLEEKNKQEKAINREIVKVLIDATLFLSRNCLAFRGHRESLRKPGNRGNFLNLIDMMSKYSPCLASYITQLEMSTKKPEVNFLTKNRQNQLISSISNSIKSFIKTEIQHSKFFSVSIDSTFDYSRKEQVSFVVRYLQMNGQICERLLALKESSITTGVRLFKLFEDICLSLCLDWQSYLIGQSYDGAQNMRGEYNGLQSFIKEKCPTATFIWCSAHRLNLVVAKTVGCSLDAVDLFGNMETVYNFICNSKKRVAYYEEVQIKYSGTKKGRRLKRVSTTRWMSQDRALQAVLETYDSVIDTLDHVRKTEGPDDHSVGHMCGCLLDYLLSKRFVYTALWFQKLFNVLAPLNTLLQTSDLDLLAAVNSINETKKICLKLRKDETIFHHLTKEINSFIADKKDLEFSEFKIVRTRRKKKMPGELSSDETVDDPLNNFKIKTVLHSLDTTLNYLDQYFNNSAVGIYKDLSLFSIKRMNEIKNNSNEMPDDAFVEFCKIYNKFVNIDILKSEYLKFCQIYKMFEETTALPTSFHRDVQNYDSVESDSSEEEIVLPKRNPITVINACSMKNVYKVLHDNSLVSVFSVLHTALKIALILPVSSASTERAFSKLKIVKSRLRTTMTENRLEDLLIISCERDISEVIDHDNILKSFAEESFVLTKHLV